MTNCISKYKIHTLRFLFLLSTFVLFIPDFGSVVLWRSGAGNYLATTTIIIIYLYLFQKNFSNKSLQIFTCIFAFLAGFSNENTSGGVILITLLLLLNQKLKHQKQQKIKYIYLFCSLLGLAILCLSPGDKNRIHIYDNSWLNLSPLHRVYQGFSKMIYFIHNDPLNYILFLLVITLLVVSYYKWQSNINWNEGFIFIISGLITGVVLCISPEGMDVGRTYFGAFTLILIGSFKLLPEDLGKLYYTLITSLAIFSCLYNLAYNIPTAKQFNNQLNQRYSLIKRSPKNKTIDIPVIQYSNNKYSISGSYVELTHDKNAFPNYVYNFIFNRKVVVDKS